jgi:hypothetical protein
MIKQWVRIGALEHREEENDDLFVNPDKRPKYGTPTVETFRPTPEPQNPDAEHQGSPGPEPTTSDEDPALTPAVPPSDTIAEETSRPPSSKLEQAKKLLTDMLTAGDRRAADVEAKAKEIGIGHDTLKRARKQIGAHTEQRERVWWLTLPR